MKYHELSRTAQEKALNRMREIKLTSVMEDLDWLKNYAASQSNSDFEVVSIQPAPSFAADVKLRIDPWELAVMFLTDCFPGEPFFGAALDYLGRLHSNGACQNLFPLEMSKRLFEADIAEVMTANCQDYYNSRTSDRVVIDYIKDFNFTAEGEWIK